MPYHLKLSIWNRDIRVDEETSVARVCREMERTRSVRLRQTRSDMSKNNRLKLYSEWMCAGEMSKSIFEIRSLFHYLGMSSRSLRNMGQSVFNKQLTLQYSTRQMHVQFSVIICATASTTCHFANYLFSAQNLRCAIVGVRLDCGTKTIIPKWNCTNDKI